MIKTHEIRVTLSIDGNKTSMNRLVDDLEVKNSLVDVIKEHTKQMFDEIIKHWDEIKHN